MFDDDLELGQLSSPLTRWDHSAIGSASLESSAFSPSKSFQGPLSPEINESNDRLKDDSVIPVPRQKLEQLMRLWIEVFQPSLHCSNDQNSVSSVLPSAQQPKTIRPNTPTEGMSMSGASNYSMCDISYKTKITVVSETEVEAENQIRRSIRREWRSDGTNAGLEDCWKCLWEPKPGVDAGLFQWTYPEEKRKGLQLDLIDALNAQSHVAAVTLYMRRDFGSIATWIGLIGLRLNDEYRNFHHTRGITPATQIEVLIECLWSCNDFSPKLNIPQQLQGPTIGDVLSSCYRRGVLVQPTGDGAVGATILREQYLHVRKAIYLINILYAHRRPIYKEDDGLHETWNLLLSSVEASMRQSPSNPELEKGKDTFFRIDDFNLKDLQSLGHLQLQWTYYWDEHLQLETRPTGNVLKIYWFQPSLARYLVQK